MHVTQFVKIPRFCKCGNKMGNKKKLKSIAKWTSSMTKIYVTKFCDISVNIFPNFPEVLFYERLHLVASYILQWNLPKIARIFRKNLIVVIFNRISLTKSSFLNC